MSKNVIVENLSMTGILKWLIKNHKEKNSNEPFNLRDVQGYVKREKIPSNYGGYDIVKMNNEFNKLYKLVEA